VIVDAVIPTLLGLGVGVGVLLLVVGVRGTVTDPSRPPTPMARWLATARDPAQLRRLLAAIAVGIATIWATGWPVAALAGAALVLSWPALFGGAAAEARRIDSLEALVVWTESLRDMVSAHASLEQAIPATTSGAPELIRPSLIRLVGRIRAQVPLQRALRMMAGELDDPSAGLVIMTLILNVRRRGTRLTDVLTGLTTSAREELEMRRRITAERAQLRRGVQLIVGVTVVVAVFLVVANPAYVAPYGSVQGQAVLLLVVGIFAVSFIRMRRISAEPPVPAVLLDRPEDKVRDDALAAALTVTLAAAPPTIRGAR
jgi:tight adherence protein B